MGWTFRKKPDNVKEFLIDQIISESEHETHRVLDVALKLNCAYMAIESTNKTTRNKEVTAMVVLIKYTRGEDDFPFGTKWMHENCGPREEDCPERILKLLSSTNNENAIVWRAQAAKKASRKPPPVGARVLFERPIWFTDGSSSDEFTVVRLRKGRKGLYAKNGCYYQIKPSTWREREWKVVGLG